MLSDASLLERLSQSESQFVERKQSLPNSRDLREALVAFANALRPGEYAVVFLGVHDDGTITGVTGVDGIQKTINNCAANDCAPAVWCEPRVLRVQGKEVVAVVIPHSEKKPHFTGHALIRVGSENKRATEQMLSELIASRNDKAQKLLPLKGKKISIELRPPKPASDPFDSLPLWQRNYVLKDCDAHCVTIEDRTYSRTIMEPLSRVEIIPERVNDSVMKLIIFDANYTQF